MMIAASNEVAPVVALLGMVLGSVVVMSLILVKARQSLLVGRQLLLVGWQLLQLWFLWRRIQLQLDSEDSLELREPVAASFPLHLGSLNFHHNIRQKASRGSCKRKR